MNELEEKIKLKNKEISASLSGKTMSVSKLLGYLHKEFDREGMAEKCSKKGFDDPESKYYKMTPEMIVESWEVKSTQSKSLGSNVDNYIGTMLTNQENLEKWKLDTNYDYDTQLKNKCDGFDQFYKILTEKTDYQYCCREEKMYVFSNKSNEWINGRFDCLFYSPSLNKYLLIDWKTSGSIDKENKWEKMFGPVYDKDACNLNEYTIQLQMYKKALSEIYKIAPAENIDTYICQFLEEPNKLGNYYQLYKEAFPYNSELLDNIIEFTYKKSRMV